MKSMEAWQANRVKKIGSHQSNYEVVDAWTGHAIACCQKAELPESHKERASKESQTVHDWNPHGLSAAGWMARLRKRACSSPSWFLVSPLGSCLIDRQNRKSHEELQGAYAESDNSHKTSNQASMLLIGNYYKSANQKDRGADNENGPIRRDSQTGSLSAAIGGLCVAGPGG